MRDPAPWQKKYDAMWVMAFILGVIGQYLFVERAAGISVLLFVIGFYCLFFYSVKGRIGGFDKWRGQSKTGWLLLAPIGLLALTYSLFANELFRFLNAPVLFALIVAQTMLVTRGGSQPWHRIRFLYEHLIQWMIAPLTHLSVPFAMLAGWLRFGDRSSKTRSHAGKIAIGLLIAAPLLLLVVALLASADSIFSSWLSAIPNLFDGNAAGEGVIRFIAGGGIALYTFCYIWGLLFRNRAPHDGSGSDGTTGATIAAGANGQKRSYFDPITAATVFICINAVYILFAAIQFTYLFGAADGLLPEGTAYAEYARRGFAELVAVAVINIGLLLIGLHFIAPSGAILERLRKVLLSVLMGGTLVMLASAYSRLSLYEETYGYTQLRLLVHGFMILLGVLMIVALVRIWYAWFSLAKIYIALAIVSYVIMNFVNIDARIVVNNIERYEENGKIDLDYLGMLSADAGPALMKLHKEHPELEGLEETIERYRQEARSKNNWQSWSLALQRMKG